MVGNETLNHRRMFELLLSRYQPGLKTSVKDSDFVFENIDGMHY